MGTREQILAAAARVMRTDGYARATTKAIAEEAGYSEATLYKHFPDKTEIFLTVLAEQLPGLDPLIRRLEDRAGEGTVRANLEEIAATAIAFYVESFPLAMSLFSTRAILNTHRDRVRALGAGPHVPLDVLARYLDAERRLGRIGPNSDPRPMAALLLGACFQQAFLATYSGETPSDAARAEIARQLVAVLLDPALDPV
jgi:AcrR family transcriptional regulator